MGSPGEDELQSIHWESDFGGFSNLLRDKSAGSLGRPEPGVQSGSNLSFPIVQETPGRYVDAREYAQGGMGRILLSFDSVLAREVIIKELLPAEAAKEEDGAGESRPTGTQHPMLRRFLQEARITGSLEHPSIVPVYELGCRENGTPYYTMKVVRGKTLAEAIQAASSLRERLLLLPHFINLCQAIAYAHSRGVIHRDLKPSNVMIGEYGETVILDWGLARKQGQHDAHAAAAAQGIMQVSGTEEPLGDATIPGTVLGTPLYMAPEQARGDVENIGERTDVYALGVILYKIITGKPPYTCSTVQEAVTKVTEEEPEPIETHEPRAPRALAAICARAMQKDPEKRYASAIRLSEDVNRFLSGTLVEAYDYRFSEQVRLFVSRYKGRLAVAAAVIVLLLGIVTVSYVQVMLQRNAATEARGSAERALFSEARARKHAEEQENAAKRAFEKEGAARRESDEARNAATRTLYHAQIALASSHIKDGYYERARRLLEACPAEFHNWEWGRLLSICNQDYRSFTQMLDWNTQAARNGYTVSPGRHQVVVEEAAARFSLMDVFTREICLSPGGKWLLQRSGSHAELHPLGGKSKKMEMDLLNHWLWSFCFSPDDSTAAFRSSPEDIDVYDLGGRTRKCRFNEMGLRQARLNSNGTCLATVATRALTDTSGQITLAFRDTTSGNEISKISLSDVTAMEFVPGRDSLLTGSVSGDIRAWLPGHERVLWEMRPHSTRVVAIVYSLAGIGGADGACRASVLYEDGLVWVCDPETGSEHCRITCPVNRAGAIALSPGGTLAAIGAGQRIYLYDVETVRLLRCLEGHEDDLLYLTFTDDGELLYSVTASDMKLWKVASTGAIRQLNATGVSSVSTASGQHLLRTITKNGQVVDWNSGFVQVEGTSRQVKPNCTDSLLSPSGRQALLQTGGGLVLYDMERGETLAEFPTYNFSSSPVAFSPRGRWVALLESDVFSQTGGIYIYEAETGEKTSTIHLYAREQTWDFAASAMAFSPDETTLVISARDGLTFYGVQNGYETNFTPIPSQEDSRPNQCWFNGRGDRLAVTVGATSLCLLNLEKPAERLEFNASSQRVTAAAFNEDGSRLVVGDEAGVVSLWDTGEGVQLITESLFDREIHFLVFTENDRELAVGDGNEVLFLCAFPWQDTDLPGAACTRLGERVEALKTYREQAAPNWGVCQKQMHTMEDQVFAAGGAETVLMDLLQKTPCPGGGSYGMSETDGAPHCSVHGSLRNPALLLDRVGQYEAASVEDRAAFHDRLLRSLPESADGLRALIDQWVYQNKCNYQAALVACEQGQIQEPKEKFFPISRLAILLDLGEDQEALAFAGSLPPPLRSDFRVVSNLARALARRAAPEDIPEAAALILARLSGEEPDPLIREAVQLLRRLPQWKQQPEAGRIEEMLAYTPDDWKQLPWHESLDAALAEAKGAGKPVLVNFTIPDSSAMRQIRERVYSHPLIKRQLLQYYVLASLAAGENPELLIRYGVNTLPALVCLDGDGNLLRRASCDYPRPDFEYDFVGGFLEPGQFREWRILGPFDRKGCEVIEGGWKAELLDQAEFQGRDGPVRWHSYSCPKVFNNVELASLYARTAESTFYAYTCFETVKEAVVTPYVELWEDGRIWLDNVDISHLGTNDSREKSKTDTLTLAAGRHELLLRVEGRWDVNFRVAFTCDEKSIMENASYCLSNEAPPLTIRVDPVSTSDPAVAENPVGEPDTFHITVNKDQVLREWRHNYAELLAILNPQPYFEDGKIVGIRIENPEKIAILAKSGFKNGDIAVALNEYDVGGGKSVLEIAELTEGSNPYRIKIKRGEKILTFVVHVE